jgi:corrinoid protein of di/trimethylamine methyltransferase
MNTFAEYLQKLRAAVLKYDVDEVKKIVAEALKENVSPVQLIDEGLLPAIKEIGEMFERNEVFLPHMVMASEAVDEAMKMIEPHFTQGEERVRGKLVLGTVEGDLHDLGKNVVMMMLKANGFEVIDIGRDVKAETFVERAKELGAQVIAASSLMSTTRPYQREIIEELERAGLKGKIKVIVGGGPCNLEWAESIGADGYVHNAVEAVAEVKRLLGISD